VDKQPIMAYNGGMILVRFLPFLLAIACLPAFAAPRPALHIRVVVPDPGMRRNLGIVSVAFSPNGRILATGGSDGEIRLWDARTGQRRGQWRAGRASASGLAFSPDGRWVISQVSFLKWGRGQAQVWDARTHHLRWARPCNALSDGVALSPNGRLLAVGSEVKYAVPKGYHVPYGGSSRGGGVCLWDLRTHRLVRRLYAESDLYEGAKGVQPPIWVDHLRFAPDGRMLAGIALYGGGCAEPQFLQRWNTHTAKLSDSLVGDEDVSETLAFSPQRHLLSNRAKIIRYFTFG